MDFTEQATVVVSILALSAATIMAWRALHRQRVVPGSEKPRQFRRFTRRRVVMATLMALVGIALPVGIFLLKDWGLRHPGDWAVFWLGVVTLLLVLMGLAVADIYAVLFAKISEHYSSENWGKTKTRGGMRGEEEEEGKEEKEKR